MVETQYDIYRNWFPKVENHWSWFWLLQVLLCKVFKQNLTELKISNCAPVILTWFALLSQFSVQICLLNRKSFSFFDRMHTIYALLILNIFRTLLYYRFWWLNSLISFTFPCRSYWKIQKEDRSFRSRHQRYFKTRRGR